MISRESNGTAEMDDSEKALSRAPQLIEQLHSSVSSPPEKELITNRLLGIARARKKSRTLIGSHGQAMPLFVSILRSGTPVAKINVAALLCVLCKDEDLRVKVLLGGCVPPLLSLLKSDEIEVRKAAAEAICEVSSGGLSDDPVGMKIFTTECVVPALWEQLLRKNKKDKVVEGFIAGALRNLCDKDRYWLATLDAGGVDEIIRLLSSDNRTAQSNAASLLTHLILAFSDGIPKIIDSGAIKELLRLLDKERDVHVRASAAEALKALSLKSTKAKQAIIDANGMVVLTRIIVAPSGEGVQGELGQALKNHSMKALVNVCGSMSALILHLGELAQSPRLAAPVADIIGALAYTLTVFKELDDGESLESAKIETILIMLLKPRDNKQVQERLLEAMASLYENPHLSVSINQSEAKKVLVELITRATGDAQEYLISSLIKLCTVEVTLWEAMGKREGVQMLISFLNLCSEQQQGYALEMLVILTEQVDDSKWAITASGGIPSLVLLVKVGSRKATEDATYIMWNLCCHSEEIQACVESAGAIPALLCLLKHGGPKGQEISAKVLKKLIRTANAATIDQLLALLIEDAPRSKAHIINVFSHVLSTVSHNDLVHKGGSANKALRSLVEVLNSSNEKTQEYAASVLANLFSNRQGICDTIMTDEVINPHMKLLISKTQRNVDPLIMLAKTSSISPAETAMAAIANLLSDPQVAAEALHEDVVSAVTRVLAEGSMSGKKSAAQALYHLSNHSPIGDVLMGSSQYKFAFLAIVDSLKVTDLCSHDAIDALEVLALLCRTKQGTDSTYPPWYVLVEDPSSMEPLLHCLCDGPPALQDKAIEIFSGLSADIPVLIGNLLVSDSRSMGVLSGRIMKPSSLEVRVEGLALLICAIKEHKVQLMDGLEASRCMKLLISILVEMVKQNPSCSSLETEIRKLKTLRERSAFQDGDNHHVPDPAIVLGGTVALWLLCVLSSARLENKITVVEAGGLEVLYNKLHRYTMTESKETDGIWMNAILAAILFQEANVISSPTALHCAHLLAGLLKSYEMTGRFFGAQAMASLVCHGNVGINLAIANSGAVVGLVSLMGHLGSEMRNLIAISEEFSLVRNPEQVVLETLFQIDDVRVGSVAHKAIPLLVDLLRSIPDRTGVPPFVVCLLTRIADGNNINKLLMAEAGVLEAVTRYLSLSPQNLNDATISQLLVILFNNPEVRQYEAAIGCMKQLVAVIRLGSKGSRLCAARALDELFNAAHIRDSESSVDAIQPFADMLDSAVESEQQVALSALLKLTSDSGLRTTILAEVEGNPLHSLYNILSFASSLELKSAAAKLCCLLFGTSNIKEIPTASQFVEPLILLIKSGREGAVESGVCAFERLLDDEQPVEIISKHAYVAMLVSLVSGSNHLLIEASISALIKLAKDQTTRKLEMVNAEIFDKCLQLLPDAPHSLCATIAELFRILTNSRAISKSSSARKIVEPLFMILFKSDIGLWGQHSALQALVNILEKPQALSTLELGPSQVIEPLIAFLESPSEAIQQLTTELFSHLFTHEHFEQDIATKCAVFPLAQLAGTGILALQETAIKALESISSSWPKELADAGGILELSKVIIQDNPLPPEPLWESTASILSDLLQSVPEHYVDFPAVSLVKMLYSGVENTVRVALNALVLQEKTEASSAELMAEAGAIDALLDLMRSHRYEKEASSLLEALFNNSHVQEMKASKYAIAPLAQYLLDPQTRSLTCRLQAARALGALSQNEGLARAPNTVSACRALLILLEDQPTEEMEIVAVCALQNFVMCSRTNRRAVAEAGGVLVIQELVLSPNPEVAAQAALLIKNLFSNHTLQEYVSNELIRVLQASLEREYCSTATVSEEVLRTIQAIFSNFHKLHVSEAATLCIPHLVAALKSGSEAAQDSILTILCLLKQSWGNMPSDISRSQAMATAEAIPILQKLVKTSPLNFRERIESLLNYLPGCLIVTIKQASNLKHVSGGTNAFCQLTIGNGPDKQTKVVNRNTCPSWNEDFAWAFDIPPKGQKLEIVCRSRSTFGKTTLGRVAIQIGKIVVEGVYSGVFSLDNGSSSSKDGSSEASSRTLEIEITWSNRSSIKTG